MKIGRNLASGLIGLSLAAFALPGWAGTMTSESIHQSRGVAVLTTSGTQIAFGDDAEEHAERREKMEHAKERAERHTHSDADEEHGGLRNRIRDHIPGTEEHQLHEEREGEEHHAPHAPAYGY